MILVRRGLERRPIVLAAAVTLFVVIFLLRQGTNDAETGLALLYVVPVALLGLELGLRAGLAAAGLAAGLLYIWSATADTGIGAVGLLLRAALFAFTAVIAGRFSDHMRRVQGTQGRLIDAGLDMVRLADADELGELVVRRALDLPGVRGARVTFPDAPPVEAGNLGRSPLRLPLETRDRDQGALEVQFDGDPEAQAALTILVLQASVARENQRLLERERELARLQATLGETRLDLVERGEQLRIVLEGQERERTQVAYELREEAAQTLAAVLVGLDLVRRDLATEMSDDRLATVRAHVGDTLGSLRALASSLRPPVLDGAGLVPALRLLATEAPGDGVELDVQPQGALGRLSPDAEIAIYRLVEAAVGATSGARKVEVGYDPDADVIRLVVRVEDPGGIGDLTPLRARVALLGGSVELSAGQLQARASLPFDLAANGDESEPAGDRPHSTDVLEARIPSSG